MDNDDWTTRELSHTSAQWWHLLNTDWLNVTNVIYWFISNKQAAWSLTNVWYTFTHFYYTSALVGWSTKRWPTVRCERKCSARWIGRKEAHDMSDPWPHVEVERSLGHLTPWLKVSHIYRTETPTNFKLGILMEYNDPHHQRTHCVAYGQFDLRGQCYNVTSVWCICP